MKTFSLEIDGFSTCKIGSYVRILLRKVTTEPMILLYGTHFENHCARLYPAAYAVYFCFNLRLRLRHHYFFYAHTPLHRMIVSCEDWK